jgi:hypothetical protein
MSKTERSTVTFIVKENADGGTSLEVHLYEGLPSLKRGNLYLELKKGTTVDEAQEIARYLKERATHLAFLP